MSLFRFVEGSLRQQCKGLSGSLVGNRINFSDSAFQWSDLKRFNVALLGVYNGKNDGVLSAIRRCFYNLYLHNDRLSIIDLGDIPGDIGTFAEVSEQLATRGVFTILLNPAKEFVSGIYAQQVEKNSEAAIAAISARAELDSLSGFFAAKDTRLSRYSLLAYQTYFTDPNDLKQLEKQGCEFMRLGMIRSKITDAEPILRDARVLTVNLNSARFCDGGVETFISPNGLYAEELCQLAWYAGKADLLDLCMLTGFTSDSITEIAAQLTAQVIWHLAEGYSARRKELPTDSNLKRFIVDRGKAGEELVFFQSNVTGRWWMSVPVQGEIESYVVIACTYDDYQKACAHDVPARWLFYYQKLNGL